MKEAGVKSKKQAKELLESQRQQLEENLKRFVEAGKWNVAGLDSADVLGPRDELEGRRMFREIEGKDDEKK